LESPSVVRLINCRFVLPATWVISGALFGLAVATVLRSSILAAILAAGIAGALSWLGRGVANLVLTCIAMLVLIAIAFQAAHYLSPGEGWSFSWLGPCALVGVILLLFFVRRLAPQHGSWRVGALVELIAAVVSLLLALKFAADISPTGSKGAALFLGSEDNDAWFNLVAILRDTHGVAEITGSSIGAFGPVVPAFLAAVSAASSGVLPAALPLSLSPQVVLSSYGLLFIAAPVIAALLVRCTLHRRRVSVTLLVWGCATVLVISSCIVLIGYASLSAALALLFMLPAAYLVSVRPRLQDGTTQVAWLASMLLLFGAGAAWIPLVPLVGAAIAACCLPVLGFAIRGFPRTIPAAAVLCLAALVMELELLQQYRYVVAPIGGGKTLFTAGGATPAVTGATQVLILAFLFAFVWLSSSRTRLNSSSLRNGFVTPFAWLVGYVVVVLLVNAWELGTAPGYGPTKLQFVLAGACVPIAVIEVVSRLEIGRRQLNSVMVLVVAVLWTSTIQGGPIYEAETLHWPTASAKTVWFDAVEREVSLGPRVLCLQVDQAAPDPNDLDPYDCSRFASSVQGKDDGVALTWRFVQLARIPVSEAVSEVKNAKDKPWIIVVIGPMEQLHNPKAWWAPIAKLPGLKFVPASG
jgi:hypothetical protein